MNKPCWLVFCGFSFSLSTFGVWLVVRSFAAPGFVIGSKLGKKRQSKQIRRSAQPSPNRRPACLPAPAPAT
jgi:hypothetical protein